MVCPLCKRGVKYESGPGAVEAAWRDHELCCSGKPDEQPRCPAPNCTKPLTASGSVVCDLCRKRVCLKHRYEDQHPCRGSMRVVAGVGAGVGAGAASSKRAPDWLDRLEGKTAGTLATAAGASVASQPKATAASTRGSKDSSQPAAVPQQAIAEALCLVGSSPEDAQEACCRTLIRLLENVLEQPKEPKFRQLNRTNKALAAKVFSVPGAEALLLAIGWQRSQPESLLLPSDAPQACLRTAVARLRDRLAKLEASASSKAAAPTVPAAAAHVSGVEAPAASPVLRLTEDSWGCPVCTLLNPAHRDSCDACGTGRG